MGRLSVHSHSQGDALGYEIVGLSARFYHERKRDYPFNPCNLCSKKLKRKRAYPFNLCHLWSKKLSRKRAFLFFSLIPILRQPSLNLKFLIKSEFKIKVKLDR